MKNKEKLKEVNKTVYQQIAELYDTLPDYVGQIARGERKAVRGKAAQIRERLKDKGLLCDCVTN